MRKGQSKGKGKGKRKGKGKCFSGRPFFAPYQSKSSKKGFTKSLSANPGKGSSGPGKAQAHEAHAKGKEAGKKKRKNKKKASAHEAEGTDLVPVQQSTSCQTSTAASGSNGPAAGDAEGFCWMATVVPPDQPYACMSDGMVSLDQNPLFVIVDIGCARA
eukprot:852948-Amphidinium_carterae.1